jgi:hypothetical protein
MSEANSGPPFESASGDLIAVPLDIRVDRIRLELRRDFQDRFDADRERLDREIANYRQWLILLGGGLGALIVAVVMAWAGNTIRSEVSDSAVAIRADVTAEVLASIAQDRSISALLPLVVGEAIDIDEDEVVSEEGRQYSEGLVIESLAQIGTALEELDGFAFDLAARRIERILDVFWTRGRYHEMHLAFNALSPALQLELLSHPSEGILFSVADALASEVLLDGNLPTSRLAVLAMVQLQAPDPERRTVLPMAALALVQTASATGWGSDETAAQLSVESDRRPDLVPYIYNNLLCYYQVDLPSDASELGALDLALAGRLTEFSALLSDEDLAQTCAVSE